MGSEAQIEAATSPPGTSASRTGPGCRTSFRTRRGCGRGRPTRPLVTNDGSKGKGQRRLVPTRRRTAICQGRAGADACLDRPAVHSKHDAGQQQPQAPEGAGAAGSGASEEIVERIPRGDTDAPPVNGHQPARYDRGRQCRRRRGHEAARRCFRGKPRRGLVAPRVRALVNGPAAAQIVTALEPRAGSAGSTAAFQRTCTRGPATSTRRIAAATTTKASAIQAHRSREPPRGEWASAAVAPCSCVRRTLRAASISWRPARRRGPRRGASRSRGRYRFVEPVRLLVIVKPPSALGRRLDPVRRSHVNAARIWNLWTAPPLRGPLFMIAARGRSAWTNAAAPDRPRVKVSGTTPGRAGSGPRRPPFDKCGRTRQARCRHLGNDNRRLRCRAPLDSPARRPAFWSPALGRNRARPAGRQA